MDSKNLSPIFGTLDSSQTFFNKKYNEAYHSHVGPISEATHKFLVPSDFKNLTKKNVPIKILDPFFGLGYNTGVTLNYFLNQAKNIQAEFICIEKDREILNEIKDLKTEKDYEYIRELLSELVNKKELQIKNINLKLINDDIFNIINTFPTKHFHAIFFDPFSYKTTPEFWGDEFILTMLNFLTHKGILTTYSSLKRLEELAIKNSFNIIRVSPLGRKKHSLAFQCQ